MSVASGELAGVGAGPIAGHAPPVMPTRRVLAAGLIGNVMEWYDFAIYGYFAVAIGANFFPAADPCLLDARRFCRVRGRLPRPTAGRRPVRPCRRPDRAQAGAHGVGGVDGRADRPDRPAADARADRRPRGRGARVPAAAARPSRRRRVHELDRLCRRALRRAAARPGRQLDGGRRHHRHPARLSRWRADIKRAVRPTARRVGLAHPLPA